MAKKASKLNGRKLSLTIIVGVFISIMVITLFNLLVSYAYPAPEYNKYCNNSDFSPYPTKIGLPNTAINCSYSQALQGENDRCVQDGGMTVFSYDQNGCATALAKCDYCQKDFNNATNRYNRIVFFVFAIIGFALIVSGLFVSHLLIQIIALPAGAFLVIEAAVRNFDDKLYVIITFALLIIAATYLAIKKLR